MNKKVIINDITEKMNSNITNHSPTSLSNTFNNPIIGGICSEGEALYNEGDYDASLRLFYEAWLKLAKPQMEQEDSEIILSYIGDTYYRLKKYTPAIEALRSALACKETYRHPQVLLRLGQALFDTQQDIQSKTYLQKAYRLGGKALFKDEKSIYLKSIEAFI